MRSSYHGRNMCRQPLLVLGAGVLLLLVLHGSARADCSLGADYVDVVVGNSVTVCLDGTRSPITCGEPGTQGGDPAPGAVGGMVRQNESTNEVDQLANYCQPLAVDAGVGSPADTCYVDECVPPGSYRYGLATPYDCSQAGCGSVGLFAVVIVSTPLPPDCQRSIGNAAPTETAMPAPWGSGEDPSPWRSCPGGCECQSSTDFRILGGDLAMAVAGVGVWLGMRRWRRT